MIKLFEPFRPKIKLHIRQDFLQELWDKYVPVTSESYDNISLIYLKGAPGEEDKGTKQVRILVDLVLKNVVMQISMSQNPMLITRNVMGGSLNYTLNHYLAQLKRTDLQTFQALNQYITYLRQAEEGNKRFESWRTDSQMLLRMEKEYQTLRQFSQSLRELSSVRAFEIERRLGNELLRSMDKTEYRILAKSMVWQERHRIAEYIRNCEETEYRQITERLERETAFSEPAAAESGHTSEEKRALLSERIEEHFDQEKFWKFYHKVLFPEKENHLVPEGMLILEKNRKRMIYHLEQLSNERNHYFWELLRERTAEIYDRQRTQVSGKDQSLEINSIQSLNRRRTQVSEEEAKQNDENQESVKVSRMFCTKLEKMYKEYLLEMSESLQDIVEEVQSREGGESSIINQAVQEMPETDLPQNFQQSISGEVRLFYPEALQTFRDMVRQLERNVEYDLEEQKNRIVEREREVLNRYQDVLHTKEILLEYQEARLSERAVEKLWSWSGALLTNMKYPRETRHFGEQQEKTEVIVPETIEYRSELQSFIELLNDYGKQHSFHIEYRESSRINRTVQEMLMQARELDSKQYSLLIGVLLDMIQVRRQAALRLPEKAVEKLWDWSRALLVDMKYPFKNHASTDIVAENMALEENPTIEYRNELQSFIEQLNNYGKQHSFHIEYRESGSINKTVQEMLMQIRELDSKQYSLLIRVLSDMIQVRQKSAREMQKTDWPRDFQRSISSGVRPFYSEAEKESPAILRQKESYDSEVEKIFRTYSGTQLDEESVRKLRNWSEALQGGSPLILQELIAAELRKNQEIVSQERTVTGLREAQELISQERTVTELQKDRETVLQNLTERVTAEEQVGFTTEFEKLIGHLNEYGQQNSFHIEYMENSLTNESIQELIDYTRELDSEQYSLFVKALSNMIEAQRTVQERNGKDFAQISHLASGTEFQTYNSEEEMEKNAILLSEEPYEYEVEKIFRTYYGAELKEAMVRRLQNWSEALQETQEREAVLRNPGTEMSEESKAEYRTDFRKLIGRLNEYGQQNTFHMEYTDSSLKNESVQELLQFIRRLAPSEYVLFVRGLAGMIRTQRRVVREWTENNSMWRHLRDPSVEAHLPDTETGRDYSAAVRPEELRDHDVERVFRSNYGTQLTAEAVRELQNWSEALQEDSGSGRQEKEEVLSERIRESTDLIEGDIQTEIIRQHIRQAKDRSELLQLVEQVKHHAGEAVRLEYREEQILNPSIQKLLRHIRQLDEEQHRIFIQQLSKMIEVQQSMRAWQNADSEMYGMTEENEIQRLQRKMAGREKPSAVQESSLPAEQNELSDYENHILDQRIHPAGQTLRFGHRDNREEIYEIYPELSRRIREYEILRKERYETVIRQVSYFMGSEVKGTTAVRLPDRGEAGREEAGRRETGREEAGRGEAGREEAGRREAGKAEAGSGEAGRTVLNQEPRLIPEHQTYESRQELKHAALREQTPVGRQVQDGRMDEERIRMKSVQAQMDVRLKQVEQQMKQVELRTNKKEDIREATEKIKKLLQEELHLEKLRRGLT